jgi:hypothetical protein
LAQLGSQRTLQHGQEAAAAAKHTAGKHTELMQLQFQI